MDVFAAAAPAATLDAVFFALSDATRRGLLERLRGTEETAGELARGFRVTRPAVSRHLRVLRQASLVEERRRGRERVYTLTPARLADATQYLDAYRVFWASRLRALKDLVESLPDDIESIPIPSVPPLSPPAPLPPVPAAQPPPPAVLPAPASAADRPSPKRATPSHRPGRAPAARRKPNRR